MKVWPSDKHGFINCELQPNSRLIDVRGAYCALSYCAGDSRKTDVVFVNGVKCNVFANLKHALVEARHFWKRKFQDREFLLWVDQLCIDQSNIMERSHQVGFMRDIYQSAEQVLICLSTEKCGGRGMTWLLKLYENIPPLEDDLELEDDSFLKDGDRDRNILPDDDSVSENISTSEFPISRYYESRLRSYIWDNVLNADFTNGWIAFYDILECQWWRRAWVFQEFIISARSSFIYGRKSISWDSLSPLLASICTAHESLLTNRNMFLELNEKFDLNGPEDRQLCRVIQRSTRAGCQAALASVKFMVTSKLKWSGSADLKCLLAHSRYCEASDDRDRVYAFLGLGDPGYRISPDYRVENTVSQVLIETTKNIILFEDSLEVLCHAAASQRDTAKSLPSWVVDWTCPELGETRNNHFGKKLFSYISNLKKMQTNCLFCDVYNSEGVRTSVMLEVWGFFVDTLLVQIISDLDSLGQRALFSSFKTVGGHTACTTSLAKHLDQIWILDGATVPLVLRPRGNGYLLVSSVCVLLNDRVQVSKKHLLSMTDLVEKGQICRKRISIV